MHVIALIRDDERKVRHALGMLQIGHKPLSLSKFAT